MILRQQFQRNGFESPQARFLSDPVLGLPVMASCPVTWLNLVAFLREVPGQQEKGTSRSSQKVSPETMRTPCRPVPTRPKGGDERIKRFQVSPSQVSERASTWKFMSCQPIRDRFASPRINGTNLPMNFPGFGGRKTAGRVGVVSASSGRHGKTDSRRATST